MITGDDSVVVVGAEPMEAVRKFLDRWSERWPGMRVAVEGADESGFLPWSRGRLDLPVGTGEALVVRDVAMEAAWDEKGYVRDELGEGPVAIYYRPFARRTAQVLAMQDPYDHGDDFIFEPYPMLMVAKGLSLVTVVTPDEAPDFTADVVETFADCVAST